MSSRLRRYEVLLSPPRRHLSYRCWSTARAMSPGLASKIKAPRARCRKNLKRLFRAYTVFLKIIEAKNQAAR
jgi:hypothetical protein